MLAIDFGTTRTKVAYYDPSKGRVALATFGVGDQVAFPSLFYVGSDGKVFCGSEALDFLDSDPGGTVRRVKSRLRDRAIRANGHTLRPLDLVTTLFVALRARAADEIPAFARNAPTSVVLTLPAAGAGSGPVVEKIMRAAATAAGFTEVELLTEPEGAAMAWQHEEGSGEDDVVVILDGGGGTVDWACLKRVDGKLRLYPDCPPGGDDKVGGEYLDEDLFGILLSKLEAREAGEALDTVQSQSNKWFSRIRGLRERFNRTGKVATQDAMRVLGEIVSLNDDEVRGAIQDRFIHQVCDGFGRYLDTVRRATGVTSPRVLLVGGTGQISGLKEALRDRCHCDPTWWQLSEFAPVIGAMWWGAERVGKTLGVAGAQSERPAPPTAPETTAAADTTGAQSLATKMAAEKAEAKQAMANKAAAEHVATAKAAATVAAEKAAAEQLATAKGDTKVAADSAGAEQVATATAAPKITAETPAPDKGAATTAAGSGAPAALREDSQSSSGRRRWAPFALAAALLLGFSGLAAAVWIGAGLMGTTPASIKFEGEPTVTTHYLDAVALKDASVLDADGKPLDPQPTDLSWSVNPATVATLYSKMVKPVGNGEATVEAKIGEVRASYKFVVALPDKLEIAGYTAGTLVAIGATQALTASVMAGADKVDGMTVTWESANTAVATVDTSGTVTGVSAGTSTIKATTGELSATTEVTIDEPRRGRGEASAASAVSRVEPKPNVASAEGTGTGTIRIKFRSSDGGPCTAASGMVQGGSPYEVTLCSGGDTPTKPQCDRGLVLSPGVYTVSGMGVGGTVKSSLAQEGFVRVTLPPGASQSIDFTIPSRRCAE